MRNKLEISSVILNFNGKRILEGICLHSETGKITGLLGRNGTGKSCLLKITYGKLTAQDKSIRINNKTLINTYRNPKDLLYLPQHNFIPKSFSLKRIFKYFKLNYEEFMVYFPEFESRFNHKLIQLSGGEQRIIEIYCILASKTKFCLLDEPFSQVMPVHVKSIQQLMLNEKQNKGIIITDHLYKNVIDICDDTYLIKDGTSIPISSNNDLIKHGYVRQGNCI